MVTNSCGSRGTQQTASVVCQTCPGLGKPIPAHWEVQHALLHGAMDTGQQRSSVWIEEGILLLFFQIPLSSACAVCFSWSLFTLHGTTGLSLIHGTAFSGLLEARPPLKGFQLILAVAEWLLKASWPLLQLGLPNLVLTFLWTCLGSPVQVTSVPPASLALPSL